MQDWYEVNPDIILTKAKSVLLEEKIDFLNRLKKRKLKIKVFSLDRDRIIFCAVSTDEILQKYIAVSALPEDSLYEVKLNRDFNETILAKDLLESQ